MKKKYWETEKGYWEKGAILTIITLVITLVISIGLKSYLPLLFIGLLLICLLLVSIKTHLCYRLKPIRQFKKKEK